MGKVLIVYEEGMPQEYFSLIDIIGEYFERREFGIELFYVQDGMEKSACSRKFDEPEIEYICTLDMAGFQIETVLGMPFYNIVPARQIHIVINGGIFALYRHMEFALNLYLFLPDGLQNECRELYIPNLFFYRPFQLKQNGIGDKEKMIQMLEAVKREGERIFTEV